MTPSHRFVLVAAAIFLCAGAPRPWAAGPDPPDVDALLRHLDDLYRAKSSIARIEIDVTTSRSTRNMRLRAWTRGEEEMLVLIEAPPREAGTATLRVGNNLWNYLPKIARTIRVPSAAMFGSWMGTDFTNDDLVKQQAERCAREADRERLLEQHRSAERTANSRRLPFVWTLATRGIDLSEYMGASYSFQGVLIEPVIYGDFDVWTAWYVLGVAIVVTGIASLYPAWFASRTNPADALRVA